MKIEILLFVGLFFYLWIFLSKDKIIKRSELNNSLKFKKSFFDYDLKKIPKRIP